MEFIYQARPARVIFGAGSLRHLEDEVQALGAQRALVLCTPEQRAMAESVAERLGARAVGVYDRAAMHVPIEVARDAREFARAARTAPSPWAAAPRSGWARRSRWKAACPSWPSRPPMRAVK